MINVLILILKNNGNKKFTSTDLRLSCKSKNDGNLIPITVNS